MSEEKKPADVVAVGRVPTRKRRAITMETKLNIIKRSEKGETPSEISQAMGIPRTSVVSIIKGKVRIKEHVKGSFLMNATVIANRNIGLIGEVEKLLVIWLEDQAQRHVQLTSTVIRQKAKSLYEHFKQLRGEDSMPKTFNASRGWFSRFKVRANLPNVRVTNNDEVVNVDDEAIRTFPEAIASLIKEGGYSARQVFNVSETGLYWKRMPSRTCIAQEERSAPGFKAAKDKLTLLFGVNGAGDFRLKPLLVYHSENPRALKGYSKGFLPVIWKSNPKTWVTEAIFEDWFSNHFVPCVREYCHDNNLPMKALLILNNAPGRSVYLDDLHPDVKVVFLPPFAASWFQPLDQGVMVTFKAQYLRRTFAQAVSATEIESGPTLKEFWKGYNIYHAVKNIGDSWLEVKQSHLVAAWRNLCPEFVCHVQDGCETVMEMIENIIELGRQLHLDLIPDDIEELLSSHAEELSNEDLMVVHQLDNECEVQGGDETPSTKVLTAEVLYEAFKHLDLAMALFEENDPNVERSTSINRGISNLCSGYREIYKEKRKTANQNFTPHSQFN